MLVRAAKPNFDVLREAAKQLVVWAINRKQEFHSKYENDNFSNYSNYRRRPNNAWKKFDNSFLDNHIGQRGEFKFKNLKNVDKNFYTPHQDVVNRSESEIKNFHEKNDIQIFGNITDCPRPIFSFDELDIPSTTRNVISKLNYTKPTPIQSQAWPIALSGLNMVGVAQTGSGKTLGFALPGLIHIKHQLPLERGEGPIVLVVAPTRELAQQIQNVFYPFSGSYKFRSACVFGGSSKELQGRALRGAEICIGTPGRIIDFLESEIVNLSRCTYCVLDEADRLLNMGFEPQIRAIMSKMRADSQILMWSATWPREVKQLAADQLKDFIGVKFGASELTANPNITQHVHICNKFSRRKLLLTLLKEISEKEENKTLIFAQTQIMVNELYYLLQNNGYKAVSLHGGKSQSQRDGALSLFRSGSVKILIGTGVVGRGLDINDIQYVINYDFPHDIEDYVHIIGRTGRCNKEGIAHTFFTPENAAHAKDLVEILTQANQEINPELMDLVNARSHGYQKRHRTW